MTALNTLNSINKTRRPRNVIQRQKAEYDSLSTCSIPGNSQVCKMRAPILMLVVISTLLVPASDAWLWSSVEEAVDDLSTTATLVSLFGKRDAQCANQLTSEQAAEVAKAVAEKCSNLDFDPEVGMTRRDVDLSFEVSDADGDGTLLQGELEKFSSIIQLYNACDEVETKSTGE